MFSMFRRFILDMHAAFECHKVWLFSFHFPMDDHKCRPTVLIANFSLLDHFHIKQAKSTSGSQQYF